MFRKFLSFLGLTSVQVTDGKASFEMTEAQMEASGKIIDERDTANAEVARLTEELTALKSTNAETERQLAGANTRLTEATTEIEALKAEIIVLKGQPAEESAVVTTDSNGVEKGKVPGVSSESNDFLTNVNAIKEAYL